MLALTVRNTKKLVRRKVAEKNIRIGNRFSKYGNAKLMADMAEVPEKEEIYVLDAGAGTGILSAAVCEKICANGRGVRFIHLYAYENCPDFYETLADNLERVRKKCKHDYNVRLKIHIITQDFIMSSYPTDESNADGVAGVKFDIAITYPPSELAERGSAYFRRLPQVFSASVGTEYLFTAAALDSLADDGQLLAYLPCTMCSATNLAKFREYLFSKSHIERIHTFIRAGKNGADDTLCKNMIIKLVKNTVCPPSIKASSSYGDEYRDACCELPPLPYEFVISGPAQNITLVKNVDELKLFIFIASQKNTLSSLGLKIHTGLTLESRYPEFIFDSELADTVPLITPRNINAGHVDFSAERKFILPIIPSLSQKNKNMLLIKRVPSKSDRRKLVCAIYLASQLYGCERISTHNKLNYIDYDDDREIDSAMLHGLYAVLSSTVYDRYCTLISNSGQTNAKDYGNIPLPSEQTLRSIGASLAMSRTFSSRACDMLVNHALGVPEYLR